MNKIIEKVVIIGGGPAGLTGAIYAARANLNPLIFEGISPNITGGQLMITSKVDNFPGFPNGIYGSELISLLREQSLKFGSVIKTENIINVDFNSKPFSLFTNSKEYYAYSIIIATGANAKLLGINNEADLIRQGGGISACATCDGAFYKNLNVAVVGGGDTAMEEALFLTRFASNVTIINRRKTLRASNIMQKKVKSNVKIDWKLNSIIDEILIKKNPSFNQDIIRGVRLRNIENNKLTTLKLDGLFVAIGHKPNTLIFENKLTLDKHSYIKTSLINSKTNLDGIFACGDVADNTYRQAITASGSGCIAALDAERYLESIGI